MFGERREIETGTPAVCPQSSHPIGSPFTRTHRGHYKHLAAARQVPKQLRRFVIEYVGVINE